MDFILGFINRIRIKLNKNVMRSDVISCLMWGSFAALLVMLISLFVPFYWAFLAAGILIIIAIPIGIMLGIKHRKDDKAAALYIDGFGLNEQIITAYENQGFADKICILQRERAEKNLRNKAPEIKVPYQIPIKKLILFMTAVLLCFAAYLIPTPAKKTAEERFKTKVEAKKAEKEVKDMIDELSKIDSGSLSEEELKELNKMMESLEASHQEIKKSGNQKELSKAKEKYNYKLGDIADKLDTLANGKTGEASQQIKSAQEMAANQKNSQNLVSASNNGNENSENKGSQNNNQNDGQNNPQDNNSDGNNEQNGNSQNGNQNQGSGENQGNGENQNQGDGQGNGDGQGEGQGEGQGDGQGQGNGDGQGQGEGQGNGDGQGDGQGQGKNNGTGQGSGQGQGEASGEMEVNHNHDYVSVNKNVTGKYGDNSTSQFSKEQNGLAWEGEKVPYDTVINEYSKTANEGISKGKYPGNMSDVVKNYFSDLSK